MVLSSPAQRFLCLVVPSAQQRQSPGRYPTTTVRLWITGHDAEATLTVFPARVFVPQLLGLGESVAIELLRENGLTWELIGPSGQPNSKVLEQRPSGDTEVDFGAKVTRTMTTNDKI